jgi:hypothetical protein
VNADLHLARERAICDLAVKRGAGQAGTGKHGLDADDFFKAGHGTLFHSLAVADTPSEASIGGPTTWCKRIFAAIRLQRASGYNDKEKV